MRLSSPISEHIRHNVVGYIALFAFAMAGTAGALPGRNTVDSGDIKKGNVKLGDLAANSVDSSKVIDNSLTGIDIDESTLAIEQPQIPSSLPPTGAAGGDLSGSYPDPQVTESGLTAGGDLTGPLSNAQVSESGLTLGGDLTGTAAAADIAINAVGNAEIQNAVQRVVITASQISSGVVGGAGRPEFGTQEGYPVLLFNPTTDDTVTLELAAPPDLASGTIGITLHWSAETTGQARWVADLKTLTPDTGELLSAPLNGLSFSGPSNLTTADQVKTIGIAAAAPNVGETDLLRLVVTRTPGHADDMLAADASLLAVEVRFPVLR